MFNFEIKKFKGISLAEVLIAITVLAIVGALLLPTFVQNFNNYILNESRINILYKFNKITENMNSNDLIGPYATTEEFVNEFTKYMKVNHICTSDRLVECWPTTTIKSTDNEDINVSSLKTGDQFNDTGFTKNVMGIVAADGTSFLLTYRDNCPRYSSSVQYKWALDPESGKPTTHETSSCIAMIFDVNGGKKPNMVGRDVLSMNVAHIGKSAGSCSGFTLGNGGCVDINPIESPLADDDKALLTEKGYVLTTDVDYWGGAFAKCHHQGMRLPNQTEMEELTKAGIAQVGQMYYIDGTPTEYDAPIAKIVDSSGIVEIGAAFRNYLFPAFCVAN